MTKAVRGSTVNSRYRARQDLFGDTLEGICKLRYEHADAELQDREVNSEIQGFFKDIEQKVLVFAKALINLMHEIRAQYADNRAKEEEHQDTSSNDVLIENGQETW